MFDWKQATPETIIYCEKYGIYEVYKQDLKRNTITYYSFYPSPQPFYKVVVNVITGEQISRKNLRYTKAPKFLIGEHGTRYNYCTG